MITTKMRTHITTNHRGNITTTFSIDLHPDNSIAIRTKQNTHAFSYFTMFCRLSVDYYYYRYLLLTKRMMRSHEAHHREIRPAPWALPPPGRRRKAELDAHPCQRPSGSGGPGRQGSASSWWLPIWRLVFATYTRRRSMTPVALRSLHGSSSTSYASFPTSRSSWWQKPTRFSRSVLGGFTSLSRVRRRRSTRTCPRSLQIDWFLFRRRF